QVRDHNRQNQITNVDGSPLAYDNNGNTTTDDKGQAYVYDAWNRLVHVQDRNGNPIAGYSYDALGRRVLENTDRLHALYYSKDWQVLEEQDSGVVRAQNVWSPVYVDALVLRDRDPNGSGVLSERLYVQQDVNWNVTAIVNTS